jgi:hypothetical protein
VFENRVQRRIFGRKREEVAGDWRRLHNEELHNFYVSSNFIGVIKLKRCETSGVCSTHEVDEKCIEYFSRKSYKGRRPLGRSERSTEINFKERICECVEGIQLRAVVNTVMNLRVPLQAVNFFKS